jgi:hypothetical protein
VEGLGGRHIGEDSKRKGEDKDASPSSQSNLSYRERINQDTTSTTHNPVIPISPRAGRYAKGSRAQQSSALPAIPTLSTLKRKATSHSDQNTPTPTLKKHKTSSTDLQATTFLPPASSTGVPLTKSAAKRLKRLAKKAIDKSTISNTPSFAPNLHYSNPEPLNNTIKPLDIFPYTISPPSNPINSSQQTCFAWYHNICTKKSKKCKELHALTQPPSFVVTPVGYVHENGVCGRDWCSGDWRPELRGRDGGEEFGEGDGWDGKEGDEEGDGDGWDEEGDAEHQHHSRDSEYDEAGIETEVETEEEGHHFQNAEIDAFWDVGVKQRV